MSVKEVTRTRGNQARWIRVILAGILIGLAALWVIVDIGPTGGLLFRVTDAHGVDDRDLLALVPLALAIALVVPLLRSRASDRK